MTSRISTRGVRNYRSAVVALLAAAGVLTGAQVAQAAPAGSSSPHYVTVVQDGRTLQVSPDLGTATAVQSGGFSTQALPPPIFNWLPSFTSAAYSPVFGDTSTVCFAVKSTTLNGLTGGGSPTYGATLFHRIGASNSGVQAGPFVTFPVTQNRNSYCWSGLTPSYEYFIALNSTRYTNGVKVTYSLISK